MGDKLFLQAHIFPMPPDNNDIPRHSPHLSIRDLQSSHAGPISLDLAAGECIAIQGASGSGKSVFLRMLADLDPNSGDVLLEGRPRASWSAPQWRAMVVYQAAEPAWWEATAEAHFPSDRKDTILRLLPALNLKPESLNNDIGRLSTGERQRLSLLRSLAIGPKVLLLDEPSASLDPSSTLAMETLLRSHLDAGMSIVLVTHSHEQAERLAQRRFRMAHGRLEMA
jgi:ABC-type iron transport system FetAB ATPase subunit